MDYFDVVLGMKFLLKHKSNKDGQVFGCHKVQFHCSPGKHQTTKWNEDDSILQLERGLAHEEPTFMAISVVDEESLKELILNIVQSVLDEYQDIMLESFLKTLSP